MTTSDVSTESIGRQAGRGLRWSLAGTVIGKAGGFAMGLVLARLLAPADFGVYAVAVAAMAFVMHVNDVGLIAATVQWRGRLEDMAATAATMAVSFSVVIYGIFWFAAPTIAGIAHLPQATGLIRLVTVVILVDGVTAVRSAALMRTFRQDKLIRANIAGLVANAGVAISLAAADAGPYSFAAGVVAGAIVTGVLVFIGAGLPWRLGIDPSIARRLLAFGIPLAASLGIEAVLLNADYIIIGRLVGADWLGYYLLAFNISTWALGIISGAVRYVSIAGFSRLSEVDSATLSAGVQRSMPLLITGLVPIVVLTATLASPLVTTLYGGEWAPAAPVLRFLMILTVVRVLTSFALDILMGAGATRSTLWVNLGWAIALVPALIIATSRDGIRGAAIAHAVVGVLVAAPVTVVALHRVGVRMGPIVPALARPVFAGVAAGGAALLAEHASGPHPVVRLCVGGSAGLLVYGSLAMTPAHLRRSIGLLRREEAHAVE
ncbi:MAG TPA: oligosaccharide flippase family protein [Actinomycetes bacterium]